MYTQSGGYGGTGVKSEGAVDVGMLQCDKQ